MICIKCTKYAVRLYWNAGAGLAVCKVVSSVLPSRNALGAGQGLTKFIHPRLDESIMLLYSWHRFGCQEVRSVPFFKVQPSAFTPRKTGRLGPKQSPLHTTFKSLRGMTVILQKQVIEPTHTANGWLRMLAHCIYIYKSIECYVENVGTLYIYIHVYVCEENNA